MGICATRWILNKLPRCDGINLYSWNQRTKWSWSRSILLQHLQPFWRPVRQNDWKQVVLEPQVSPEHTWKYVDTVTVFAKTWTKGHWPLDDLWPHICWGLMCDSTQGSLCPSPMEIHQNMWIQWPFCKNFKWRSLTPRWPLTPHLLRSHVWLYPKIIVSKSHENTLKYVDTVTFFAKKLEPKVIDP